MAKITMVFGVLLILLGAVSFHYSSLIPIGFGFLLVCFGALAQTPESRKRMMFMHIAVSIGLLGFLLTAPGLFSAFYYVKGKLLLDHPAIEEKAAMSLLMLIYVVLCVRSFIIARRSRI